MSERAELQQFDREELYRLVWSEPMSKLAPRYGLSDRGLAKLCHRMAVPVPPRGHWAKLAHGKNSTQPPLPPVRSKLHASEQIALHRLPVAMVELKQRAKAVKVEAKSIEVAVSAPSLHPLVHATELTLTRLKSDEYGMVRSVGATLAVRVAPPSIKRAMALLSSLLYAAEAAGWEVVKPTKDPTTAIIIDGQRIEIELEERSARQDHIWTDKEKKDHAKHGLKPYPRWDHLPSGELTLQLARWSSFGIKKRWSDGKRGRIEDHFSGILATLPLLAEALGRQAAEARQREIEAAERARRYEEEQRRQRYEQACLEQLEKAADHHAKAEQIRRLVDAAERSAAVSGPESTRTSDWLSWARSCADNLDPLHRGIEAMVEQQEKAARVAADTPPRPSWQRYG